MSLLEQINSDIKTAMKAKEREKLEALRAVKAAFIMEMTKTGASEIDEDSALKIIQRLVKQRKDSASTFKSGGREDLADKELFRVKLFRGLPSCSIICRRVNNCLNCHR